jgi:undecaprenyl-diphosphatase
MDQKLLFLINRAWTGSAADRLMALVSSWDVWLPFALIGVVLCLIKGGFRARTCIVALLVIVGINDGLVSNSLKHLAGRPRPHQAVGGVRVVDLKKASPRLLGIFSPAKIKMSQPALDPVEGRSFPSSHTVNMFSAALVTVAFYGRRAAWTFAVAALVGYSRIYVGSHWPSDVLTSIFIGLGSSLLLLAALDFLWRRRGGIWLPAMHDRHPRLFAA